MKKFLCKRQREAFTLAVLLLSTLFSQGNIKRTLARYTQSNLPGFCLQATPPSNCTSTVTGVICTSTSGSVTTTWYLDACVTVLYRQP